MKNPNGYGSVVKLGGKRRKPFAVRKTIGWNEKNHPVYKTIGYFTTREEGMIALATYNNDPWDIDRAKTTFAELFELWREKKMVKLGTSNQSSLRSAYNHCKPLYKMKYKDIKSFHMQDCIDNCNKSYSTQGAIKALLKHLDKFALEMDIVNRCYSDLLSSASIPDTSKEPFTAEELAAIWGIEGYPWADSVLVSLYTGFRVSELLDLRKSNVDLEQGIIKGGTKTKAGKDRVVPIHTKILPMIVSRLDGNGDFLFGDNGKKISTATYYKHWNGVMDTLKIKHTHHECRHTFRSRLDSEGANKRCIDLIMGHKSKDVGERVYTHKSIQELKEAIELLD